MISMLFQFLSFTLTLKNLIDFRFFYHIMGIILSWEVLVLIYYIFLMYTSTVDTPIKWLSWWYTGGKDLYKIRVFWRLEDIDIVLYNKIVCNYLTYNIPIKPHKTHTRYIVVKFLGIFWKNSQWVAQANCG